VATLDASQETKLLETRSFRYDCGCTLEQILPILGGWKTRLDELFEGADVIHIQCPRCAANYRVTRDMIR
jgi:molecular chaperone Hsp33